VGERLVAHLEVLAEGVQREERAHLVGQEVGEELERGQIADGLEVPDVLTEEPVEPLLLPAAQGARGLCEERLREASELKQPLDEVRVALRREIELPPR
jgi:hypothetical protein